MTAVWLRKMTQHRWGLNGTQYLPDVIDLDVDRVTDYNGESMRVDYTPRPDRTNTAEQFWNH